jgi:pimeloyl-ACP methyl ester carboxylesterase
MQLTLEGARFDVLDEGSGPAIVLLHGFPLSKETWDAQVAALRPHARVVRFDLRGLGASGVTPGPYLMESLAGDVAAVLDALEIERAVVAGHSLGGYVAFAFYRMFAERCLGLAAVCTRAGADEPAAAAAREELATLAERTGIGPVVAAYLPRYFAPRVYAEAPETVERVRAIVERTDPLGAAAMLRGIAARVSSEDVLEEITVPVCVVAGLEDAVVPVVEARALAAALPNATLELLACGHFPLLETPGELSHALLELLRRVAISAGRPADVE